MGVSSTERVQADGASPGRRDGEPKCATLSTKPAELSFTGLLSEAAYADAPVKCL
jgi:hypothetical protein